VDGGVYALAERLFLHFQGEDLPYAGQGAAGFWVSNEQTNDSCLAM
jgi:hypothetical protein